MQEYPHISKELKIAAVIDSGKFIILEDGSRWQTFPFRGVNNVGSWQENSSVLITPGKRGKIITYHLKNLEQNEKVIGIFIGFST